MHAPIRKTHRKPKIAGPPPTTRVISARARELVIPGGNHAQFGLYGPQDDDGEASLSPEEQRVLTADEIAGVFL